MTDADRPQAQVGQPTTDERTDLIFKALSSKPRREILALLATGEGDDPRCCSAAGVCACVLVERVGLGAPTVSHHMKALIDAGLVSGEKHGTWMHYQLRADTIRQVVDELMALVDCCGGTDS